MALRSSNKRQDIVDEFIQHVIDEMERQSISRAELAERAGCGLPYLYRVLNKEQSPTLQWANRVATALGISIEFHASQ